MAILNGLIAVLGGLLICVGATTIAFHRRVSRNLERARGLGVEHQSKAIPIMMGAGQIFAGFVLLGYALVGLAQRSPVSESGQQAVAAVGDALPAVIVVLGVAGLIAFICAAVVVRGLWRSRTDWGPAEGGTVRLPTPIRRRIAIAVSLVGAGIACVVFLCLLLS